MWPSVSSHISSLHSLFLKESGQQEKYFRSNFLTENVRMSSRKEKKLENNKLFTIIQKTKVSNPVPSKHKQNKLKS